MYKNQRGQKGQGLQGSQRGDRGFRGQGDQGRPGDRGDRGVWEDMRVMENRGISGDKQMDGRWWLSSCYCSCD